MIIGKKKLPRKQHKLNWYIELNMETKKGWVSLHKEFIQSIVS